MVDSKSVGGCITTVLAFTLNEAFKSDITFITLTAVGFSTILYNVIRIKNEWHKNNQ
ncbi:hypothetical protein ACFOW1_09535 [Parasediminibacterium paludis]|uniref:Uncharacterized protein n=1 Tax=Parasediminibacterium paludis TaxID=908966 RepID=A0ABV8PYW7_9BACT